ncbi:MAG: hypothetical protein AMXMBFR47_18180 [Planctomycetota bacterium]
MGTQRRAWIFALLCYSLAAILVFYLSFGVGTPGSGALAFILESTFDVLEDYIGDDAARYLLVLALALIPAVASLLVFSRLMPRGHDDGMLHCPKCDYVLKGLSEPRCPECGERI